MSNPETYIVNEKELKCVNCGENLFYAHDVKLNKSLFVFLDIEMFSKGGKAFVCDNCGYKHEFYT